MLKAVIWDLYGTLFISKNKYNTNDPGDYKTFKKGFQKLNDEYDLKIDPQKGKKYYQKLVNKLHKKKKEQVSGEIESPELDIRNLWKIFFSQLVNERIDKAKAEEIAEIFERTVNPVYIPEEHENILLYLQNRNIKQGILSNSQFYSIDILKEELGKLTKYFDKNLFVLSYKAGISKPDEKIYDILIKKLKKEQIEPENCLMVGNDKENDIKPLKLRGLKTIYISKECEYIEYADYVINEMKQMYEILENLLK